MGKSSAAKKKECKKPVVPCVDSENLNKHRDDNEYEKRNVKKRGSGRHLKNLEVLQDEVDTSAVLSVSFFFNTQAVC